MEFVVDTEMDIDSSQIFDTSIPVETQFPQETLLESEYVSPIESEPSFNTSITQLFGEAPEDSSAVLPDAIVIEDSLQTVETERSTESQQDATSPVGDVSEPVSENVPEPAFAPEGITESVVVIDNIETERSTQSQQDATSPVGDVSEPVSETVPDLASVPSSYTPDPHQNTAESVNQSIGSDQDPQEPGRSVSTGTDSGVGEKIYRLLDERLPESGAEETELDYVSETEVTLSDIKEILDDIRMLESEQLSHIDTMEDNQVLSANNNYHMDYYQIALMSAILGSIVIYLFFRKIG